MALTEKLTAIADAIRGKTGKTDGLTLEQMPGEIAGIQTGGDTSNEDAIITRTIESYSNDRIVTIGSTVFNGCNKLTSVSFPNATSIGSNSFNACSALHEIYAPKVTAISDSTFRDCAFTEITDRVFPILEMVSGDYSFRNCKQLVYFQSSTWENATSGRHFDGCSNLTKVDVSALKAVKHYAFDGCVKLESLILRKTDGITTLTNVSAFSRTMINSGTGYIYVPSALIEEYKVATNWSTYAGQFRAIEDYPEICEVGV